MKKDRDQLKISLSSLENNLDEYRRDSEKERKEYQTKIQLLEEEVSDINCLIFDFVMKFFSLFSGCSFDEGTRRGEDFVFVVGAKLGATSSRF